MDNEDLKYIRKTLDGLREDIVALKVDVGQLQVKAGIWGSIWGFIAALAVVLIKVGLGG